MNIFAFGPLANILYAAYAAVGGLEAALAPLLGGFAAAGAIIALTILVRTVLVPVGASTVRAEFARARVAPKLAALRRTHRNDPVRLQSETMALYRQEHLSPFAGLLALVVQAPVVSMLYALFVRASIAGHANILFASRFFGVPLGASMIHELTSIGLVWPYFGVFVVVLGLIAIVAALSRRLLVLPGSGPTAHGREAAVSRVLSFLPFLTVVAAAFVPLAAALYLLTTTAWTIAERIALRRLLDPVRSRPAAG